MEGQPGGEVASSPVVYQSLGRVRKASVQGKGGSGNGRWVTKKLINYVDILKKNWGTWVA